MENSPISMDLFCINDDQVTKMAGRPGDKDSAINLALVTSASNVSKCDEVYSDNKAVAIYRVSF